MLGGISTLADIIRDWWFIFVGLGILALAGLFGFVLYLQWDVWIAPMFQNMSMSFTAPNINLSNLCNCNCTG